MGNNLVWCTYNNLPLHRTHIDVCIWHFKQSDPKCKGCEWYAKLKGFEPVRRKMKEYEYG